MTTIAWDGETLAVDSQVCEPKTGRRCQNIEKLFNVGDFMIAGAGDPFRILKFVDWFEENLEDPISASTNPFADETEDEFTAIVVDADGKAWEYNHLLTPIAIKGKEAWGTGGAAAMALMETGKTAKEAIEVICRKRLDIFTGGPVQWATVGKVAKKTKCKGKQPC